MPIRVRSANRSRLASAKQSKEPMSLQMKRPDFINVNNHTQASYDPKFNFVESNMSKGLTGMSKALSRQVLP